MPRMYSHNDPLEGYPEDSPEKKNRRLILEKNPCAYSNCYYVSKSACPYLDNRHCPYFTPVWAHT